MFSASYTTAAAKAHDLQHHLLTLASKDPFLNSHSCVLHAGVSSYQNTTISHWLETAHPCLCIIWTSGLYQMWISEQENKFRNKVMEIQSQSRCFLLHYSAVVTKIIYSINAKIKGRYLYFTWVFQFRHPYPPLCYKGSLSHQQKS